MTGAIPRVVTFNPAFKPSFAMGWEINSENRPIATALRSYFYDNGTEPVAYGNGTRPDIPLSCPTSRCEWPVYETPAVCSRCEEVSDSLEMAYTCLNTTIEWSSRWMGPADVPYSNGTVCGHFINATTANPILLTGYVANGTDDPSTTGETLLVRLIPLTDFDTKEPAYGFGSIRFKDVRQPILDALIASGPNEIDDIHDGKPPIVNECMLSWCVQTVKSTYEWGTYKEDVVSTYLNTSNQGAPWPWYTYPAPFGTQYIYNQSVVLTPPRNDDSQSNLNSFSPTYSMTNITAANVMNLFDDIFPSSYTATSTSSEPRLRYFSYGEPLTRELFFNPWQAPVNQSEHFEKMAKTMTNVVRSSTDGVMVAGDAYSMKNFIRIKWAWLIFPFVLLLLSFAFLVSTMQKTSKDGSLGVWKTSAMPTLIYGLPEDTRTNADQVAPEFSATPPSNVNVIEEFQAQNFGACLTFCQDTLVRGYSRKIQEADPQMRLVAAIVSSPAFIPIDSRCVMSRNPPLHPITRRLDSKRQVPTATRWRSSSTASLPIEQKPPSLDFTQRIERKIAEYNASEHLLKRWLFEIVCWVISASSLGAIIGIYAHINNMRLADCGALLTFANILGKVASAVLIIPVTEALGQLKWNWFNDSSKAMWDFEIFDKATRGPWGAAVLLYRTKGRSLAALGALLVVLVLAIDAFLQQLINMPDRWALQVGGIAGDLSRTIRYEPKSNTFYRYDVEIVSDSPELFPITRKFAYSNGTEPLLFGNGTRPEVPVDGLEGVGTELSSAVTVAASAEKQSTACLDMNSLFGEEIRL
ncbi:hypothetical protein OPT61_g4396 [Boeremia exigua]|uniref:Uncharacterized protein n=1 Tax=Boeremia exigua TaxID=749465 RepID=A0ACC2IEG4_9PLEO|nr:hypothetical protein OPT61_g4396 [Boeremia exigua]